MKKQIPVWLLIVCFLIFNLILLGYHKAYSQRNEEVAKEMEPYNPWQAPKAVIDNTINKVLPFDVPTDTKIKQDEELCFKECAQERDVLLQYSKTEVDKGYAWADYQKCVQECPEKVANQNKTFQGDSFNQEKQYPPGSAPSLE